jgi:hypothetical protein
MQINPVHFNGAVGGTYWPDNGACEGIWPQHTWQTTNEAASREYLAEMIWQAEWDIKQALGYSPALTWEEGESHAYPKPWLKTAIRTNGRDQRGYRVSVHTRFGHVNSPGVRASTLIEAGASVNYSDSTGDGWFDTATVSVSSSLSDMREIKLFFPSKSGLKEWEIRPLRSVSTDGATITITADSWLFINPNLWEAIPTSSADFAPIDISGSTNFVTTCDVYRVYNDTTQRASQFKWEPDSGTTSMDSLTTQNGTFYIRDEKSGEVVPTVSSYTSPSWSVVAPTVCRDPDVVDLWYYAGRVSQDYENSLVYDPLPNDLAQAISWLAAARIETPVCSCTNVQNIFKEYQRDMVRQTGGERFFVLNLETDIFTNPFGTRVGEYRAWQKVAQLTRDIQMDAGVI